jgi:hypothetical protein
MVGDDDLADEGLGVENAGPVEHGARLGVVPPGGAVEDVVELGVAHIELEHEAVELGLGEGVGALLLDRVLGREDEEGLRGARASRPTVTERSCIASSRADWVLGVARLISSARTIWAKIGPFWKTKLRRPVSWSSLTMLVPMTSAGIRSGVNWIRLNGSESACASVRTSSVLPSPGTPSSSTLPPANRQVSTASTTSSCPTITVPISVLSVA